MIWHVEIPVMQLERAILFYETVFQLSLRRATVDAYRMAFFPTPSGAEGASVALAVGDVYTPSRTGALIYFHTIDIEASIARALAAGADLLFPVTNIGDAGFVAEFSDSEGNRIGLAQPPML